MKINKIQATSRVSTKIKETFYTFEYSEERLVEETDNIEEERENLWDTCNEEVDKQLAEIISLYKK